MSESKFRTGISEIKKTAAGGGGKRFTPNIYWKDDGESKTIAWLTSASEIPKVDLHLFVKVPDDTRDQGFRWENFLCRKDASMIDESAGYCELCDRVGHAPVTKFVGQAVELKPTKEGKKVTKLEVLTVARKNKDGVEVEYPQWGLVFQAAKNFMSYLAAYEESTQDITEIAWEVIRDGKDNQTKYHHMPLVTPLPDLSKLVEDIPTVIELLEEMGSDEKYEMVKEIAAGSQPSRFGSDKENSESGSASSRDEEFERIRAEVRGEAEKPKVEAY
jgi:hypothetical protein